MAQCPEERLVPLFAKLFRFDIREGARNALISVVHRLIDGRSVFCRKAVFLIPDVERRFLERNAAYILGLYFDHRIHGYLKAPLELSRESVKIKGGDPDNINDGDGSKIIANFGTTTYCVRSRRVRLAAVIVKIFLQ